MCFQILNLQNKNSVSSDFELWKKKWTAKEVRKKKKEKEKERELKEENKKSNFQNLEGIVLRRGWVFHDMEVNLEDSKKPLGR